VPSDLLRRHFIPSSPGLLRDLALEVLHHRVGGISAALDLLWRQILGMAEPRRLGTVTIADFRLAWCGSVRPVGADQLRTLSDDGAVSASSCGR